MSGWIRRAWEFLGSDPDALAQLAHIGWGGFLTLAVNEHGVPAWIAGVIVFVFAVAKELSELWTESEATRGSTIADVLFWLVGILLAMVVR